MLRRNIASGTHGDGKGRGASEPGELLRRPDPRYWSETDGRRMGNYHGNESWGVMRKMCWWERRVSHR